MPWTEPDEAAFTMGPSRGPRRVCKACSKIILRKDDIVVVERVVYCSSCGARESARLSEERARGQEYIYASDLEGRTQEP